MAILERIWTIFYWTAFGMCWFVLPFMQEFVQSGEFTLSRKIKATIHVNVIYYAKVGVVLGAFVIYLWTRNETFGGYDLIKFIAIDFL